MTVIDEARTNFKAGQQEVSLDSDLSNADTTIAQIEQRVASADFSVDGFSFNMNCTHASSVLTTVKGTKKKPKIVQEKLAELQ